MPIVTIHMLEGREAGMKKKLIRNVTETIRDTLECPQESIRVILQEMAYENYGVAGLPVKEYRIKRASEK